jgi:predicted O-methyltransferase YrrM
MDTVLANADRLLPEFRAAIDAMPAHEHGPGIFVSEMFLFYCVVRPLKPRQILESGRDRGGSTLMLAHCFPQTRIVSVEFESNSPNAAVGLSRLAPHRNVECLFGDSREVLPKLIERGDPVLIDGPKEFRALKLALRLLRTGKPSVVFLHDFPAGSASRQFLDRHWPGAFFSDQPDFLRRFGWLDAIGESPRPTTFACLPARLPALYHSLLTRMIISRAASLAPHKVGRFFERTFRS